MDVSRDMDFEDRIYGELGGILDKPRTGTHVSDLLYCARKAVLKKLRKPGVTRDETIKFSVGRSQHDLIQTMRGYDKEVRVEFDGIVGSIDMVGPLGVIEIKGTRASLGKHERDGIEHAAPYYVAQVRSYNAMLWHKSKTTPIMVNGQELSKEALLTGHLLIMYINGAYGKNNEPALRVWKLQFTPDELESWLPELQKRRDTIEGAVRRFEPFAQDDAALTNMIQENWFPDGPRFPEWECKSCAFEDLCYPPMVLTGSFSTAVSGTVSVSGVVKV